MGSLVDVSEKSKGTSWPVDVGGETLIGRIPGCGVCLSDGGASRRHCIISPGPKGPMVRDLGSANGTFVNGERVAQATLQPGDRLRVGFTELEFRDEASAEDAPTRKAVAPTAARIEPATRTSATVPTMVPAPVARRQAAPGVAAAPVPRLPEATVEFCSRCSGSVPRKMLASGRARIVDGELLCGECLHRNSTRLGMVPVNERPAEMPSASTASARAVPGRTGPGAVRARPGAAARPAAVRQGTIQEVTVKRQVWAWIGLAVTLFIFAFCMLQMPAAWLNFRRLVSPERVPMQSVAVEETGRTALGITLSCTIKPEGGAEVKTTQSAGLIGKYQYDNLVRQAKASGGVARFDVVYDAKDPARSALRNPLYGLPTIIVALIMLLWAAYEAWQIAKFYTRPAPVPVEK